MKWVLSCNGCKRFYEYRERRIAQGIAANVNRHDAYACWVEPEDYEEYFGHDGFDFAEYLRRLIKCIY